ncbi:class I SAM-dependent methyltransferase [Streptomyces sp. NPDC059104]|uniref:class I SAM-dependent methyltransferase n=1 Tax=Streptomyces sp. NPDC059104 TaxID=3346729 RepID=UPI0036AC412E
MSFDHNDHYHRLLLRQVPQNCRTALDVGCGTGRFARRLAALGIEVDAFDSASEVIGAACAEPGEAAGGSRSPNFWVADLGDVDLPRGRYDFISCLASIHHLPFDTVVRLREALAPGGVLVILGCYPERSRLDWAWSLAAVPVNAVARFVVAARERVRTARTPQKDVPVGIQAPVKQPEMSYEEIRAEASVLLPGSTLRRLLFWRYLLTFHQPT